jgi:penicillin-binding protein 2
LLGGRSTSVSDQEVLRRRGRVLMVAMVGLFVLLGSRLFALQVVQYEEYVAFARKNHLLRERVLAPRGLLLDRRGEVLADNVGSFEIAVSPETLEGHPKRVERLCSLLGTSVEELDEKIQRARLRNAGKKVPVVANASKRTLSLVMESRDQFPPLDVRVRHLRRYPRGAIASHLVGYVGEVGDQELDGGGTYHRGDVIGRSGMEVVLEDLLRGRDGEMIVEVNASGQKLAEWITHSRPPRPGNNVYLSIDLALQTIAENRLGELGAGAAVMMDVRTGEVLVAASQPAFDPGDFSLGLSPEEWSRLTGEASRPLYNRFAQATYPPGSTFKVITALAALDQGIVSPTTRLSPCYGSHRFGNRTFRCWWPPGHGRLDLVGAIVQSCDVYFYQLGERIDLDLFARCARRFGLGSPTGSGLPGESAGLVPDTHFYDTHPRFGKGNWTRGNVLNLAIGQGEILVTVLQMADLMATIGSRGRRVPPRFVSKVVDAGGEPVQLDLPEARNVPGIDHDHLETIRKALLLVTEDKKGTGHLARVPGVAVAGKTGTAQNPHGEDHAWFVGYAPADAPEVAFAVLVENAGHGGSVAAPLAAELLESYFHGGEDVASREEE